MPFAPSAAFPVDVLPNGDVAALAPVTWHGHRGDHVDVPTGYVSDWGSVPWFVRAVLPNAGPLCRAFLVHDVLCSALAAYQRALATYVRGIGTRPPTPPPFDAVDTDAVLRVILAELGDTELAAGRRRPIGTGPARWLYWEGVRAGALASPARRAGFCAPRVLVPFLLLLVPALLLVLPAAVGALVSRALIAVGELLCAPWETRARRKRARDRRDVVRALLHAPTGDAATRCAHEPPCPADPEGWPTCIRPGWHVHLPTEEPPLMSTTTAPRDRHRDADMAAMRHLHACEEASDALHEADADGEDLSWEDAGGPATSGPYCGECEDCPRREIIAAAWPHAIAYAADLLDQDDVAPYTGAVELLRSEARRATLAGQDVPA